MRNQMVAVIIMTRNERLFNKSRVSSTFESTVNIVVIIPLYKLNEIGSLKINKELTQKIEGPSN